MLCYRSAAEEKNVSPDVGGAVETPADTSAPHATPATGGAEEGIKLGVRLRVEEDGVDTLIIEVEGSVGRQSDFTLKFIRPKVSKKLWIRRITQTSPTIFFRQSVADK